jgi:hypothetical protein
MCWRRSEDVETFCVNPSGPADDPRLGYPVGLTNHEPHRHVDCRESPRRGFKANAGFAGYIPFDGRSVEGRNCGGSRRLRMTSHDQERDQSQQQRGAKRDRKHERHSSGGHHLYARLDQILDQRDLDWYTSTGWWSRPCIWADQ